MDEPSPPPSQTMATLDAAFKEARLTPGDLLTGQEFLRQEQRGLVVDLSRLEGNARLVRFVNRVFGGGCYFKGLHYKTLGALLYDFDQLKVSLPQVILAASLAQLNLSRVMLYQGELNLTAREADYDFTMRIDSRQAFAQGVKPPGAEEAQRNVDEFVAMLWNKGVRFGLDLEAIAQGLAVGKNKYLRLTIAKAQAPQPGDDARVEPLLSLQRDLRPLESAQGQVDLRRYLCVFPQARAQQTILRKVPATAGRVGHSVLGEVIPTTPGKDLSLAALAGQGTEVAQVAGAECLLASQTGYISVHPNSGAVSVTDEVIIHEPVGIKTGSLTLEVERCLLYGGVSAGYTLEANHLVCRSGAIEGAIVAGRGDVAIEGNVTGGQVTARQGSIQVRGLVQTGSRLEAYQGQAGGELLENCQVVARKVTARRAVNSLIIAQEALLGECLGCNVFAYGLAIERVRPGLGAARRPGAKSGGTTLAVPIAEPRLRPLAIIQRTIEAVRAPLPELAAQAERIGNDQEVQRYLRALKAYQAAKDEEAHRLYLALLPLEKRVKPVVDKWRAMLAEQRRIQDLAGKLEGEAQAWREKIRHLEQELQAGMHFMVKSIEDDFVSLRLYKDPRLPPSFEQAAALEPERRRKFEALAQKMAAEVMAGHSKELILTLKEPFKASFRDLASLLAQAPDRAAEQLPQFAGPAAAPDDRRRESRLLLLDKEDLLALLAEPERQPPPQRLLLPVRVDEVLEGYFNDLSGVGASLFLSRRQRYVPIFQAGEKISLVFKVGGEILEVELAVADVQDYHQLVRVGGPFVNLPSSQQAAIYKLKNALEARLHGEAG